MILVDFRRLSGFNPAIEKGCTAPIPAIQVPYIFRVDDQGPMKQKKKKKRERERREEVLNPRKSLLFCLLLSV
jgi:hypothetical protein